MELKYLHLLNDRISTEKHIYIYGTSEFSAELLCYLIQLQIYVKGFVYDDIQDKTDVYGKNVYNIDELDDSAVLIVPSIYSEQLVKQMRDKYAIEIYYSYVYKRKIVSIEDDSILPAFIINNEFKKKETMLYGMGKTGKTYYDNLINVIEFDYLGDSDTNKIGKEYCGKEILSFEDIGKLGEINVAISPAYTIDIYKSLDRLHNLSLFLPANRENYYIYTEDGLNQFLDFTIFYEIVKKAKQKRVCIYGYDNIAKETEKILKLLDVNILGFLSEKIKEDSCEKNTLNIYDLLYEKSNEVLVIIPDLNGECVRYKLDMVSSINENIECIYLLNGNGREQQYIDVDHGYTNKMTEFGFKHFKNSNCNLEKPIRIVTLGNSATYANYKCTMRSWSEILFEKLTETYNVEIICGGINGYNSYDELIGLIRDVISYSPDFVISYSGVNDMGFVAGIENYPYVKPIRKSHAICLKNEYKKKEGEKIGDDVSYGVKNHSKDYDVWLSNMRMMSAICKEFGIVFLSILQPTIIQEKYKLSAREEFMFCKKFQTDYAVEMIKYISDFYDGCRKKMKDYDYIYDFSNAFEGKSGLFFDPVHVSESGNCLVATKILEILEKYLKKDIL